MGILFLVIMITLAYISLIIASSWGSIVIGTISKETIEEKANLKNFGFKIIHADDFRNKGFNYEKAGKMALKKFIFDLLLFKKTALFTSNPILFKLKPLLSLTASVRIKDKRSVYEDNVEWAENLSTEEILEYLPAYFEKGRTLVCDIGRAKQRLNVFLKELERSKKERPLVFVEAIYVEL